MLLEAANTHASSPAFSFSRADSGLCPDVGFEWFHFFRLALKFGFRVREESVKFSASSQEKGYRFVQFPVFGILGSSSLLGLGHTIHHDGSNRSPSLSKTFFMGQPFCIPGVCGLRRTGYAFGWRWLKLLVLMRSRLLCWRLHRPKGDNDVNLWILWLFGYNSWNV